MQCRCIKYICINALFAAVFQDRMTCKITYLGVCSGVWLDIAAWFWMMSEQDLADVVQIAVEDLTPDNPGTVEMVVTAWERWLVVLPINKMEIPVELFLKI